MWVIFQMIIINFYRMIAKTLLILLCLSYLSNTLYFGIGNKPFCFQIESDSGKTLKFSYEVSGDNPQKTRVTIQNPLIGSPVTMIGASNKTSHSADQNLNICFLSLDGSPKSVSVDIYTTDKAHLLELAKKSEVFELHSKLLDVGEGLKEISKNQMFQQQRQIIHAEIINTQEAKVKNFAVIKLVAIVAVAVAQIFLLRKILDNKGSYSPL